MPIFNLWPSILEEEGSMIKILILVAVVIVVVRFVSQNNEKIQFFTTGMDKGFKISEIFALWKLARVSNLENPESLYFSLPLMSDAISHFIQETRENRTDSLEKNKRFLTKLYDYRTRISLEHENNKSLDSSKYLDKHQKLRIILPGSGVFKSEILENGTELIIKTPTRNGVITVPGQEWVGKKVHVYLWRKGDAAYVFDSVVNNYDLFLGSTVLRLKHSTDMIRTQKRESIRSACQIEAQLYFVGDGKVDYDAVDATPGFRCILEDISEGGSLIRVGGKGVKGARLKIQFNISDNLIVMFGVVVGVEYNKNLNQSRLHFECIHMDETMKNIVLSFVYKTLPEDKKEALEAISLAEEDASPEEKNASGELDTEMVSNPDDPFDETVAVEKSMEGLSEDNSVDDGIVETNFEDDFGNGGFDDHFEDKMNEFRNKMEAYKRS